MQKKPVSEARLKQVRLAARKHGAYAFRDRGETALDQPRRDRLVEIREQVEDRTGVLDLLQEQTATAVMMVELITSYVAEQARDGETLSDIKILGRMPAFMNSAQRALKNLLDELPDAPTESAELNRIREMIDGNSNDTD